VHAARLACVFIHKSRVLRELSSDRPVTKVLSGEGGRLRPYEGQPEGGLAVCVSV
jgi:hypothetical protein